MDVNHASCWDSIVEKVRAQLPSIDFDSSSSDNEEVTTIYQRPAGLSLELPEDFDFFSLEEQLKLDDDELVGGPDSAAAQWDVEVDACERDAVGLNRADSDASVRSNVDDTKSDLTVLSFARLEEWDLDDALHKLKKAGVPLQECAAVEPLKTHTDVDQDRSQRNIMEELVAFCNSQSSKSASEPVISPHHIRHNNKLSERMEAESQLSQQECPAVCIDLRCPDPSIKPQRTSQKLSSESKSPAKRNTDQDPPPAKKSNHKEQAGSQTGVREVTGKSMLLRKIREMNRNGNKCPIKYTEIPYSAPGDEAERREKLHQPVESTFSHESHSLWGDKPSPHVQFEPRDKPTSQKSATKEQKQKSRCATTKAELLLVVSPAVPPRCYGRVLEVCGGRGFGLRGLHRLRLQGNAAAVLRLSKKQARVFCSPQTLAEDELESASCCLVLLLRKENALQHSVSLPAALMRDFKAQKLLGFILSTPDGVQTAEQSCCFHTVPYNSNMFNNFVRGMWDVPDPSSVILSRPRSSSHADQLLVVSLCGPDLSQGLSLLHRLLTSEPEGLELLGLKFLPALTRLQAQGLSPYEVGQKPYQASLVQLRSCPVLVCTLRRGEAVTSLRRLLPHGYPGDLSVLMSSTPQDALRQTSLFFSEHEMIPGILADQPSPDPPPPHLGRAAPSW